MQLAGFGSRSLLAVLCSSSRRKQAHVSIWGLLGVGRRWFAAFSAPAKGKVLLLRVPVKAKRGGGHGSSCGFTAAGPGVSRGQQHGPVMR